MNIDYNQIVLDFIKTCELAGEEVGREHILIVDRGYPHKLEEIAKGKMGVYTFRLDETYLKVGGVNVQKPYSFESEQYSTTSEEALAQEILQDPEMAYLKLNDGNIEQWMKQHLHRVDYLLDENLGNFILKYFQSFLALRLHPKYEQGGSPSRKISKNVGMKESRGMKPDDKVNDYIHSHQTEARRPERIRANGPKPRVPEKTKSNIPRARIPGKVITPKTRGNEKPRPPIPKKQVREEPRPFVDEEENREPEVKTVDETNSDNHEAKVFWKARNNGESGNENAEARPSEKQYAHDSDKEMNKATLEEDEERPDLQELITKIEKRTKEQELEREAEADGTTPCPLEEMLLPQNEKEKTEDNSVISIAIPPLRPAESRESASAHLRERFIKDMMGSAPSIRETKNIEEIESKPERQPIKIRNTKREYDGIKNFLRKIDAEQISLTIDQMNNLLDSDNQLPIEAEDSRRWWINDFKDPNRQCYAWIEAGYKVTRADLNHQVITFVKNHDND